MTGIPQRQATMRCPNGTCLVPDTRRGSLGHG